MGEILVFKLSKGWIWFLSMNAFCTVTAQAHLENAEIIFSHFDQLKLASLRVSEQ